MSARAASGHVLTALVCVGVGFATARLAETPSHAETEEAHAHGAPRAGVDAESIESLRASVRAVTNEVRGLRSRPTASAAPPSSTEEEDVDTRAPIESPEAQYEAREAMRAFYADAHAREPVDAGWARSQEQALWTRVHERAEALGVREIACRSTSCRIDYESSDHRVSSEWLAMMQSAPFPGKGILLKGEDGGGVVYVPAPGRDLPRFPDAAR